MNKVSLSVLLSVILLGSALTSVSYVNAFLPENLPDVAKAPYKVKVIKTDKFVAYAKPLLTTFDHPSEYVVSNGGPNDGVVMLVLERSDFSGAVGCSGTLLTDFHILTAAHCVSDDNGNLVIQDGSKAYFGDFDGGHVELVESETVKHPDYDGDFLKGNDIAIVKLSSAADSLITRYNYDSSENSVGSTIVKSSYGVSGPFSTGYDSDEFPFGNERIGQNKYDAFADLMYQALGMEEGTDYVKEAIYQYDSDDGFSSHDAFGFFFDLHDLGLGHPEVLSAPGDSGGPTLVDFDNDGMLDTVVGVTSYGIVLEFTSGPPPRTSDCTTSGFSPVLDSSCGEFAGDTRVSTYSNFVDSVLGTSTESNTSPVANDDSDTTPEDTAVTIDVLANDSDDDGDSLTVSSVTQGSNGDVTTDGTAVTYTPHADFNGQDSFTYTISDGNGGKDSATVTVTVEAVNDSPVANDDSATTTVDTAVTINVLANDSDVDGDTLFVESVVQPENGGVILNDDDTITYTPDTGFSGDDSFSYTINDGNGATDSATVTVTVNEPSIELTISSIEPESASRGSTVDVTITGTGFAAGLTVSMDGGSGPTPSISNVVVQDDSTVTATVSIKSGGPPRNSVWDVIVTLDDTSAVLENGFTVTPS